MIAKLYSWPVYVATARRALRAPVRLLVIAPNAAVARWAEAPIALSEHGSVRLTDVLGPEAIPEVTRVEDALEAPEIAVLSALAHARGARGMEVVTAAHDALVRLDAPLALTYLRLVWAHSRGAVRAALEALMQKDLRKFKDPISMRLLAEGEAKGKAEGKAEGEAEGRAQGKAEAIFAVLEARGLGVSSAVAERIRGCHDLAELDRWVRRAATVARAEDLFGAE